MKNPLPDLSVFLLFLSTCSLLTVPPALATEVAMIGSTPYLSLISAYSAAVSGDTIRTINAVLPDNGLNINAALGSGKRVIIRGGYQADFSENNRTSLPTILTGSLVISSGTFKVDHLAIRGKPQSISGFNPPATATFGAPAITLTASASSGLPVNFTVVDGTGSITGNLLTITGAGIIHLTASQAGNGIFNAAIDTHATVTVSPASQAITFTALPLSFLGSADFPPGAISSSGLPVSYTSDNPAVATIHNGLVRLAGAGQTTITASQSGGGNYQAATPIQQNLSVALPHSPIDNSGLEGYWPLDGSWQDETGHHNLTPVNSGGFSSAGNVRAWNNQAYGPTKMETGNGATDTSFTSLPEENGITMEGWVWLPDDSTGGLLFGFGNSGYEEPKLNVSIAWGFIEVNIGKMGDGALVQYDRIGDTCWHHLALVLPKGFRSGIPFHMYVDGKESTPAINSSVTGAASLNQSATLFGSPFGIGNFVSASPGSGSGGNMKIDEVRAWSRGLAPDEITALTARTGSGALCENSPPPVWAPGPRFVPPVVMPVPELTLGVHVLSADTIAVISDPNPWIKRRMAVDSGAFLRAMEPVKEFLDWQYLQNYEYAAKESISHYRPQVLAALANRKHFTVASSSADIGYSLLGIWPQATREFRAPLMSASGGELRLSSAEVVFYSYLKLPAAMVTGQQYSISDTWGNQLNLTYNEQQTISWALKVNQVGYLANASAKYAYLGGWLGPQGGALDISRFVGQPFYLCREDTNQCLFSAAIEYRWDETAPVERGGEKYFLSGENVAQLDFSSFAIPGRYYIKVPGVGRSWAFDIGPNGAGEAFYTHIRGLYHQRCATLDSAYTAWARGDSHFPIRKGSHPSFPFSDYADHTADGWGFMDANGMYPSDAGLVGYWFPAISAGKTNQIVSDTSGEWHDAGDFDRIGTFHLLSTEYLNEAYLMFPDNFSDGQLNIPESGNGIPDILDEATWGVDLWRRMQESDGRVALWVEAESHPKVADPAIDHQPYYLGLATRNTSIMYAEHAARLARALKTAGTAEALVKAQLFLDSAKRAYEFAVTDFAIIPRISAAYILVSPFITNSFNLTWSEPPQVDSGKQVKALVQLWLASGDVAYYNAINTTDMTNNFKYEAANLYWRGNSFDFIDVALAPDKFPAGWGDSARSEIIKTATEWLNGQAQYAYRPLWFGKEHGYFPLMGWGSNEYLPVLHQIAAWRVSGEMRFRNSALNAVDFLQGANPQGRSLTTGLGQNYVVHPLHLPADSDGIADPVPGITIYGYNFGIPLQARTAVYGLFSNPDPAMSFAGSSIAQLPPPFNDTELDLVTVGNKLYSFMPVWRNLSNLESYNVPQMEFDVSFVIGPAAAALGCLMEPGWMPSLSLKQRQPKSAAELQDALWFHP